MQECVRLGCVRVFSGESSGIFTLRIPYEALQYIHYVCWSHDCHGPLVSPLQVHTHPYQDQTGSEITLSYLDYQSAHRAPKMVFHHFPGPFLSAFPELCRTIDVYFP